MTQCHVCRRRFLHFAAALPLVGLSSRATAAAPVASWSGTALGAASQITIVGLDQQDAKDPVRHIVAEIDRLENIFSLFRAHSEVSRLNRQGHLNRPSPDLLHVLSLTRSVWDASFGAFDPTVQTEWAARQSGEKSFPQRASFSDVSITSNLVTLTKPNMQLTFNGIAQGYITDQVTMLLASMGLRDIAVSAGETRVMGTNPDHRPWRVGIQSPAGHLLKKLQLKDRAIATSAPSGTTFPDGTSHIIDPRSRKLDQDWTVVSIASDTAVIADALSTAACSLSASECRDMLSRFKSTEVAFRV